MTKINLSAQVPAEFYCYNKENVRAATDHMAAIKTKENSRIECGTKLRKDVIEISKKAPLDANISDPVTEQGSTAYAEWLKQAALYNSPLVKIQRRFPLPLKTIEAGTEYLADKNTPEYRAISKIVSSEFVCIKDKKDALEIFKNQYSKMSFSNNDDVFVLNPNDTTKIANAKKGTSNAYMAQWYAEANNLEDKVISPETLSNAIEKSKSKNIKIVVPDDCAITGRSMIMQTARALNEIDVPDGKTIELIYSPMVVTETSKLAFEGVSFKNFDLIKEAKIINERDEEILHNLFDKYKDSLKISKTPSSIVAKPFYKSETYINVEKNDPILAEKIKNILTMDGKGEGYGRYGQSGVMIAVPSPNGLKCPNNNAYGAAPFAILEGAKPDSSCIKTPGGSIRAQKWNKKLKSMQEELLMTKA